MTTSEKVLAFLAAGIGVVFGIGIGSAGKQEATRKAYVNGVVDGIGQREYENSDCSEKTKDNYCKNRGLDRDGCNKVAKIQRAAAKANDEFRKAVE
jgi:hypothetical protein